ncbi:hypothetical protein [Oricola sp.]|uniref:hypothetical protein n=1 Tax=Oricola sp. TaxID=1979950 RepID=UPI0025D0AB9E|nr:hypothetical protein [Oricola sp.]MCI5074780.1 hypothetical protein [Oricola sp.]
MDWALAVERNREALLRIVAALFAMVGLDEARDNAHPTLPRFLHKRILRLLRPAEAAVRRLVIIAAHELETPPDRPGRDRPASKPVELKRPYRPTSRHTSAKTARAVVRSGGDAPRAVSLLDPLSPYRATPPRRYAKTFPRFTVLGLSEPRPLPELHIPSPDDPVSARHLFGRLQALKRTLDTIDDQARRLVRWRARRNAGRTRRFLPMRPGRPPGHRRRPRHAIDEILRECHSLALHATKTADTS